MSRIERQLVYWNTHASGYEKRFGLNTGEFNQKVSHRANSLYSDLNKTMKVLEVGCGTGVYTRELSKRVNEVVACDLSVNMLELAPKLRNVTYMNSDCHSPPVWVVDAVVGTYILQYLNVGIALSNYYEMLRSGGRVAFLEPCALNPYVYFALKTVIGKRLLKRPRDTNCFAPGRLARLFEKRGFKDIEVSYPEWHRGSFIIKARKP